MNYSPDNKMLTEKCSKLYSKTCVKQPLSKRQKIDFQNQLSLNVGHKYCRMLQMEHSAIFLTFIKLPVVIKSFILSIFEWLLYKGFIYNNYGMFLFPSRVKTMR